MKKVIIISFIILIFVLLGMGVEYKRWEKNTIKSIRTKPTHERAIEISRHHDFLLKRIKNGMSKEEVGEIIGEPMNTDNEHIWAWAFCDESHGCDCKRKWMDLLGNGIMYIVFVDDKVIGNPESIYASAAQSPIEMIMGLRRCDKKTAMTSLGIKVN